MPLADDAIFTLAQALSRLSNYGTKLQFTPSTRQFLLTLAKTSKSPEAKTFYDLLQYSDAAKQAAADTNIGHDPLLHAILHNTIAPVFLSAGFRGNVIPGIAQAKINMRLIPGSRIDDVIQEIQSVVHDSGVTVALADSARPTGMPATDTDAKKLRSHIQTLTEMQPSSTDTDLYKAMASQAQAEFHAPVTPYLFQAGTDAAAWRSRGIPVYGIYPYPVSPDDTRRMHGNDERISVHSLDQGTDMIYKTILQLATK
jgi:acetylornithine deacetylase/succinyl-diaminopimelate desuccinylase-like protein